MAIKIIRTLIRIYGGIATLCVLAISAPVFSQTTTVSSLVNEALTAKREFNYHGASQKLIQALSISSSAFEADGLMSLMHSVWFHREFDFAFVKSQMRVLLPVLEKHHGFLYQKMLPQLEVMEAIAEFQDGDDPEMLYDKMKNHLLLLSEQALLKLPFADTDMFATTVISYMLEDTRVANAPDWLLYRSLARVLGHEMDEIVAAQVWFEAPRSDVLARELFPLFKRLYTDVHGTEGPKQKLFLADQLYLDSINPLGDEPSL